MKVSQISFDVKLPDEITSDQLIKIIETVISSYGEHLGSNAEDITEAYIKGAGLSESDTITLTTYSGLDDDKEDQLEFTIPMDYAKSLISKDFGPEKTLGEFLNEYTWDCTEGWLAQAKADGVLIDRGFSYTKAFLS